MRLYHRTSFGSAMEVLATQQWTSLENPARIYFSDRSEGHAVSYGDTVLMIDIPKSLAELEDEFPDGEKHYAIPLSALDGFTTILCT